MDAAILRIDDLEKWFGGTHALDHLNFDLQKGEIHALVGANGSGKSTLVKIVTGALSPDGGTIFLRGVPVSIRSPLEARCLGVSAIYQEPTLIPDFSVEENVSLGHEPTNWPFGRLNRNNRRAEVLRVLEDFGLELSVEAKVADLGIGQQRIVEIAKVLSEATDIICVDEATAGMSNEETRVFFEILRRLRDHGVTIIYISHYLENTLQIADRATVLRDGRRISTDRVEDLDETEIVKRMLGRTDLQTLFPRKPTAGPRVLLEGRGLSYRSRLHDISFSLRECEVLGVAGMLGAGKTELARLIYGAEARGASGILRVHGKDVDVAQSRIRLHEGIAYVPEDRKRHGIAAGLSVAQNILVGNTKTVCSDPSGFMQPSRARRIVREVIDKTAVKIRTENQPIETLSGGNQQKAVIGKWIVARPEILLLDEPTRGIDVGAKSELYRIIAQLASEGRGIMLFSSEIQEIVGLCTRVIVLYKGSIAKELSGSEITEESVLSYAMGVTRA